MIFEKDMQKTDLVRNKVISAPTLSKLSKGESINTDIQDRLCKYFGCQLSDIAEYVQDKPGYEIP
jgi:DNA-binding Xre family transcriptional regulator